LIILPYLGNLSFDIRKRLNSCFNKTIPFCSLKIIFRSNNRLSSIFSFKDRIPKYLQSHLIYKYTCCYCNVTYYGKTERHLKIRSSEHLAITPLTGKTIKNPKASAILDHIQCENHLGSYSDFDILAKESNNFKLLIKESLLIQRDSPVLNRNVSSIPLELF